MNPYHQLLRLNAQWMNILDFSSHTEARHGLQLLRAGLFKKQSTTKKKVFYSVGEEKAKVILQNNPSPLSKSATCSCHLVDHNKNEACRHIICCLAEVYRTSGIAKARVSYLQEINLGTEFPFYIEKDHFDADHLSDFRENLDESLKSFGGPMQVDLDGFNPETKSYSFKVHVVLSEQERFNVSIKEMVKGYSVLCNCQTAVEGKLCIHEYAVLTHIFSEEGLLGPQNLSQESDLEFIPDIPPEKPQEVLVPDLSVSLPVFMGEATDKFSVSLEGDWLTLTGQITWGTGLDVDLIDIIKAVKKGLKYVTLPNETLGKIPDKLLKRIKSLLATAVVSKQGVKIRDINVQELETFNLNEPFLDDLRSRVRLLNQAKTMDMASTVPVPSSLCANLRDYQIAGYQHFVRFSQMKWGMCLNDDMGLGKTIQSIAFLTYLKDNSRRMKALVISPVSVMRNWGSEISRFAPSLRYVVYHGQDRSEKLSTPHDVLITSYSILNNDIDVLRDIQWDVVIIDEAHHIRNIKSLKTQAVLQLSAKYRYALTGTLIQNSVKDLFPVFDFLNPGIFGTIHKFKADTSLVDSRLDRKQLKLISQKVSLFTLRRRKEDVAKDLPERIEETLFVEMSEQERQVYQLLIGIYQGVISGQLESGVGGQRFHTTVLPIINKLRFACDSTSLLAKDNITPDSMTLSRISSKIEVLRELIQEIISSNEPGKINKVLVFAMFTSFLDVIESFLEEDGMPFYRIDGSVSAQKRLDIQDAVNDPSDTVPVCLVSITAGGEGMNLQGANYVFILDPHWNPAIEKQAYGRSHRIGQKQTVFVYRLVCGNTIEERILDIQERKKSIAGAIEDQQEVLLTDEQLSPSDEDIRYMFGIDNPKKQ